MTDGLDVLVQDVIAAMTTEPLSIVHWLPSANLIDTGVLGHACSPPQSQGGLGSSPEWAWPTATGSLAGNDSAEASSRPVTATASAWLSPASRADTACGAMRSGTRSCGRLGPAIDGSTVLKSSSTVCE